MLLFGMSYICLQIFQLIGISHTHFLSYNPTLLCLFSLYKKDPLQNPTLPLFRRNRSGRWRIMERVFCLYYFTSAQPKAARFASISAKIFSATLTGSVFTYITEPKRSLVSSFNHFVTASEPCVGGSTQW